jgi:translation initiation factor 1A
MPKNMGKGGKAFKKGKAGGEPQKRELVKAAKELGEEYAMIKKTLGNLRLECQLENGSKVIGVIRGALVRKVWITPGDVVIVSKREFNEADNVDILHKFQPAEVRELIKDGEIPRDFKSQEDAAATQNHADVEFVQMMEAEQDEAVAYDRHAVAQYDPLADLDDGEGGDDDEDEDLEDL